MTITGRVVHLDLEGGFWGIEGDDGKKYKPSDALPLALTKHGIHIRAEVERVAAVGISMWGRDVRILKIEAL